MGNLAFDRTETYLEENDQDKLQIMIVDNEEQIRWKLAHLLKSKV